MRMRNVSVGQFLTFLPGFSFAQLASATGLAFCGNLLWCMNMENDFASS